MGEITTEKAFSAAMTRAEKLRGRGFQADVSRLSGVDSSNLNSIIRKEKGASEAARREIFKAVAQLVPEMKVMSYDDFLSMGERLHEGWKTEDQAGKHPIKYLVHYHGARIAKIQTGWNAAKRRANISRRLRCYDLRHMTASEMLAGGVDIKTVSEILGNTPEQCMKAYLHVRSPAKQSAVDKL